MESIEKECKRCHCIKGIDDFHHDASRSDKRYSYCKACVTQLMRDRYKEGKRPRRPYIRDDSAASKAKKSKAQRARYIRLRDEAYEAYGGRCSCCGEDILEFLTIDHVKNNGSIHRKEAGYRGIGESFYLDLKRSGYPPDFQVLCINCNFGKRRNGGICPHKSSLSTDIIEA
jgi:hypothetical protein